MATATPALFRNTNRDAAAPRRRSLLRRSGARQGAAVLELSMLLPVFLMIMLLAVDFGRLAYWYIAVINSARAGAGFGSAHPCTPATLSNWTAKVQQAARDELGSSTWSAADQARLTIGTPVITPEASGMWRAEITVTYNFQPLINWPFLPNYGRSIPLHKNVVMRGIF
jgi:Flp pilus assembly protein TadG